MKLGSEATFVKRPLFLEWSFNTGFYYSMHIMNKPMTILYFLTYEDISDSLQMMIFSVWHCNSFLRKSSSLKNSNIDESFYLYLPLRFHEDLIRPEEKSSLYYYYAGNKLCPDHKITKRHVYSNPNTPMNPNYQLPDTMTSSSCPSHLR